ncbi:MAG: hypothetical protein ABSH39_15800 [Candidatus Acidiferrum sp.]
MTSNLISRNASSTSVALQRLDVDVAEQFGRLGASNHRLEVERRPL